MNKMVKNLFNSVGIVARTDRKDALVLATKIVDHLKTKKITVFLEPELAESIRKSNLATPLERMRPDMLITIGGDGIILRTCLEIPKHEPPILAVDIGVRGFLTEVKPNKAIHAVDQCLHGKFKLERCTKLASFVEGERLPDALNEVLISPDAPVKLLYAKIWADKTPVAECRADAVMVASQVGSTGYSLTAGGPVLDPRMDAFVLTPVCPLAVFHPMVFPVFSTVTVEINRPQKTIVVVDGHYRKALETENPRLTISKSEYQTTFIRFRRNFYRRLEARMLFYRGGRG
jgi:NAD+ kinase